MKTRFLLLLNFIFLALSSTSAHAFQNPAWIFTAADCSAAGARCVEPITTEWTYFESPTCSGINGMGIPESENGEALVRDCAIATLESYGMPPKGLGKRCSNYSASGYGWSGILNFPNFPQLVRQEKPDNNFIKYKFWDISDPASPDLHCIGEGEVAIFDGSTSFTSLPRWFPRQRWNGRKCKY